MAINARRWLVEGWRVGTVLIYMLGLGCFTSIAFGQEVTSVPDEVRKRLELDDWYQKHLDVGGLPIVGSKNVSDEAILEAAWIVQKMLQDKPEILVALGESKTRLTVMAYNEYTTDVPEHRHLRPKAHWDRRARGLGATQRAPAVSCAEENLLCHPRDPYSSENILIHEFAHAIHQMAMPEIDPTFDNRLKTVFDSAIKREKWKGTYAATNRMEYWAEGVQSWFNNNREADAQHNQVNTRQELVEYDPDLARLCEQVFSDREWTYRKPLDRKADERIHLRGIDFDSLPEFHWRQTDSD